MKKVPNLLAALVLTPLLCGPAQAGEVNFNINIGTPPVPIIVPSPPLFLVPPALGFRVAIDLPYEMVFIDGRYYTCRDHVWYVGPRYDGPWTIIAQERLPPGLRKFKLAQIRDHRDREHRKYKKDKRGYRGKAFRPGHDRDNDHPGKGKGHKKNRHD